jgi:hypothetical protein
MSADSKNSDKKWSFHLSQRKPPPNQIFEGGREGHEDRITERASNLKKMFSSFVLFVRFVVKILTFGCGSPRQAVSVLSIPGDPKIPW